MKQGIIFDMDGTLWDSSENVAKAWDGVVREKGYTEHPITAKDVQSVMGWTMDRIAEHLFSYLKKEERKPLLDECCLVENAYLREHGGVLYPDLEKTLLSLSEMGFNLYIVSNCQSGYIESFLDHYHFGHLFEDTQCYGDNGLEKGENIALVVERNRLDDAYYVGDIQGDYDASSFAGVPFIHATYGFGTVVQEVERISTFSQLTTLMKAHVKK